MTKIGVALVGPGLVGRLVLEQLTAPAVKKHFDVVAVSNSSYTVFQEEVAGSDVTVAGLLAALPPSSETSAPPTASTDSGCVVEQLSPGDLVAKLAHVGCRRDQHILLLDCTASDTYPKLYADAISSGLSVVTPNKVAFSSDETLYRGIVEAQGSSPYAGLCYFEGACGAGLPILTTLGDLVGTGDEVTRIEAVLSGTLSYIFNQFSKAPKARSEPRTDSFSEIVRRAHRDGHTVCPFQSEPLPSRPDRNLLSLLPLRRSLIRRKTSLAVTSHASSPSSRASLRLVSPSQAASSRSRPIPSSPPPSPTSEIRLPSWLVSPNTTSTLKSCAPPQPQKGKSSATSACSTLPRAKRPAACGPTRPSTPSPLSPGRISRSPSRRGGTRRARSLFRARGTQSR